MDECLGKSLGDGFFVSVLSLANSNETSSRSFLMEGEGELSSFKISLYVLASGGGVLRLIILPLLCFL